MGALIHTPGTGYLCGFYNNEFDDNWGFHHGNAHLYNRGGVHKNVWTDIISTVYDGARKKYPLVPKPPSSMPNVLPRWQYFFQKYVLTQANQDQLLDAIHYALTTAAISGILFGVRHGSAQGIETATLNGAVQIQMINIVMDNPMSTGIGMAGGPPEIDQ
jgi:hypothetical protein